MSTQLINSVQNLSPDCLNVIGHSDQYEGLSACKTLAEIFNDVAVKHSDRIAVSFQGTHLTYGELNARASRLAAHLSRLGVKAESLVGVFMERSADMIVALVAILKAGGAYLPLDASTPAERLAITLDDAQPAVLLTESGLIGKLPQNRVHTVCLDSEELASCNEEASAIASQAGLQNLAYVIYTSGSTGKPKGVMVTHGNVARLLSTTADWFHFNECDVWTFFHSSAFDFSVWEIWGCLLHGGRLVVVPFAISRSPQDFYDLLVQEQVTVLNQTPSAFYQLIAVDEEKQSQELALRLVIFGGEVLNFKMLRAWFAAHGDKKSQLVNMYGITETTVHVTYRVVTSADAEDGAHSLIGIPIPDLQLYLLTEKMQPVSPGEVGEIYVGGPGVARGYLNRPELNAQRFVSDPFSGNPDARLYKSGDLARVLPDGELEYLGRGDAQVKIQGFRIELGEIEAVIAQHMLVRQARVIAHTDAAGTKRLVAYYATRDEATIPAGELSEFLSAKLPAYMMPSVYMQIEAFPLTSNGKLDQTALPAPSFGSVMKDLEMPDSGSELEKKISGVWREVLGADHIGLNDNFFDIGGTSLLLVSIHSKLQSLLNRKIPITDLFACTTVHALAQRLEQPEKTFTSSLNTLLVQVQNRRDAFARARSMKRIVL